MPSSTRGPFPAHRPTQSASKRWTSLHTTQSCTTPTRQTNVNPNPPLLRVLFVVCVCVGVGGVVVCRCVCVWPVDLFTNRPMRNVLKRLAFLHTTQSCTTPTRLASRRRSRAYAECCTIIEKEARNASGSRYISLPLSLYIYIYIYIYIYVYIYIYMCVCVCIYIFAAQVARMRRVLHDHRERSKERVWLKVHTYLYIYLLIYL